MKEQETSIINGRAGLVGSNGGLFFFPMNICEITRFSDDDIVEFFSNDNYVDKI